MRNDEEEPLPAIIPSWLGPSTLTGPFRTPQSFTLISADHLLAKLAWDMQQLEAMQWDENLGTLWRQAVSYKAIDCATSIWHLGEWFSRDIRGTEPRQRACAFLGIEGHEPARRIDLGELRQKAIIRCPDLDICRIIAIASKHYDVGSKPRPEIRTSCYLATALRDGEPFKRPFMHLTVVEDDEKRDMRDILTNCRRFWEQFLEAARPA
jgi:hypothetical protein